MTSLASTHGTSSSKIGQPPVPAAATVPPLADASEKPAPTANKPAPAAIPAGAALGQNRGKPNILERFDNVGVAARRTLAGLPTLKQVAHEARRTVKFTVPGMAIAGASSWAFAKTISPALLRVSAATMDLAATLQTLPVVGGIAAKVLGAGSHFGLWGGAGCLLSASVALLTSQGSLGSRLKWAAAHVVQGFALSPFWVMAASGTLSGALPGVVLAVGCMVGVSMVLAQVADGERASWTSGVLLASLSCAGGPIAAQLALGAELAAAATTAGFSLALGALAATVLIWRSHFAALDDNSTALFRKYELKVDKSQVLDLPGLAKPRADASVFVDNAHLHERLGSIRVNMDNGGSLHNERMLLCGKPGNGKSVLAKSIQQEFGWPMSAPPASLFVDCDKPATKITEVMEQARREAELRNGPVGLIFDEAEKLFPNRSTMRDAGTVRADQAWMMTTTFNDLFEGVGSSRYANVFVIVITNHKEATDPAFLSRFSGQRTVELAPPNLQHVKDILRTRWLSEHAKYSGLKNKFKPYAPTAEVVDRLAAACRPAGENAPQLSGRDLNEAVNAALTAANGKFGAPDGGKNATQADFEAALLVRFEQAVEQHHSDAKKLAQHREQSAEAAKIPEPAAANVAPAAQPDPMALLQQVGLDAATLQDAAGRKRAVDELLATPAGALLVDVLGEAMKKAEPQV